MKRPKKETISLQFEVIITIPYTYDVDSYSPRRNKKIEKAIMKWVSARNIKSSITNSNEDFIIPFYVEKDKDGSFIEETTEPIKVHVDSVFEV